ncbi:MutS domain I protein [Prevotella amnii CRIS 21A-A]|uniref:MutS domain I protein n=1 Tax=Prevotella amnii CRIS 21A-A TaxID=679191 RepID=E1GUA6_9BACT|nr:ArdC-like ssDNA-binding domain-containing protein [Prevotella amnii]EFN91749.1 MutS domain I protein [Prevotella amnii CRIS 21A-A]
MPGKKNKNRPFSYERSNKSADNLQKFADMMVKIIETAKANNWKKGWMGVNGSVQGLPQNISGRTYSGGNSFFLMFNTAEQGYKTPVYMTFLQAKDQNLQVKPGEKSVPVFKWGLSIKDEDGNKISEEVYNTMSKEERSKLVVRPFPRVFSVFNIDQTNLEEVNKKKYDAIVARFKVPEQEVKDTDGMYVNEALDRMFETKAWYAKIQYDKPSEQAFYRPSTDTIVLPMKSQFKLGQTPEEVYRDGMEYYSTALHEMAHSTGHENRLNRSFGQHGTDNYAHEELIAEMTSALVGSTMGFDRKILDNHANYLSGWLNRLKGKPETISTIMTDVGKASDMIIDKIDEQRIALNQKPLKAGNLEGIDGELVQTKERGKTLQALQEKYSRINSQYPFSVDDDRTRQIAKRIRQAEQIIMAYNANVESVYGEQFAFSAEAQTRIIPQAIYSGREHPVLETKEENVASDDKSLQKEEEVAEMSSLSEDSNPATNVASIAEKIMEKGNVPKEVAEKQATVIADAQQAAIEEKKQKVEQAKQAALKKAEDERRREVEEEKRREEENKQQEKDSGPSSKLLLHAALLLGALELAKGNKGIWMNKAGKSNAEFIGAKRPIMAYNSIMMNLQSDRQGYRSNVYTTYDSAKDAGTAVKQNEESLAFNWVKWDYQHVGTKELISREDYDKLPTEEKEFYIKHKSKEAYGIFNIDQTTMPAGKQADYIALLKDKGAKIDQLSERGVSSMMKFAEKLKSNHPTSMVIARTDSKYQIYGKDASRAGKLLNLPVSQTEENGQKVKSVSFPLDRINDYLPKLVEAKQWVVVAENLDSAELIRQLPNEKEVISNANQTAQRVAKSAGIGYERVMVLQDAAYDKQADKIIVSGMSDKDAGDSRQAALQKANDIYRAVVAATGSEHRLDRMGRNNLLPGDDAKYERFVQDLAAGVLMARQGLPATLSKESMQNVNYLQREIRENPKMLGLIEKDINNAIESIDKHLKQEIVKYEDIRKELTPKDLIVSPKQYKISSDLAKIPDIESKQIVIVRDKAKGAADVILPEGASLDDDVEISGIRKDRIKIALGKEGISDVKFYNAGGGLGLNETNDYYKGKEVSVDKLKQYDFSQHRDIDVKPQIEAAKVANIKLFTPIKDDKGQYAFFFKVDNEPSFAVYPNEAHKRAYFDARNTDQKKEIHDALAQKYYSVAQKHPEIKVDLIMPKVPAVDMSKIERPTITKDGDDPNKKYVMATIDGKLMKEPISKNQWNRMWLADDMSEYKKAVAAVTFAPFLKVEEKNENLIKQEKQENVSSNQEQTPLQSEDTNEEDVQQEETTPITVKPRGMGIG